jgi:hypothetical protein
MPNSDKEVTSVNTMGQHKHKSKYAGKLSLGARIGVWLINVCFVAFVVAAAQMIQVAWYRSDDRWQAIDSKLDRLFLAVQSVDKTPARSISLEKRDRVARVLFVRELQHEKHKKSWERYGFRARVLTSESSVEDWAIALEVHMSIEQDMHPDFASRWLSASSQVIENYLLATHEPEIKISLPIGVLKFSWNSKMPASDGEPSNPQTLSISVKGEPANPMNLYVSTKMPPSQVLGGYPVINLGDSQVRRYLADMGRNETQAGFAFPIFDAKVAEALEVKFGNAPTGDISPASERVP